MTSEAAIPDPARIPEQEEADRLRQLARELAQRREAVLATVGRIGAQVREGAPAGDGDLAELAAWQESLAGAARQAGRVGGQVGGQVGQVVFRLASLDEAAEALDRLAAERRDGMLAGTLAQIAGLGGDAGRYPQLGAVAEQARALDPAAMPQQLKDAFHALRRLMVTAAPADVDAADAELVLTEFGMAAMLASVGALRTVTVQPATPPSAVQEPAVQEPAVQEPAVQEPVTQVAPAALQAPSAQSAAFEPEPEPKPEPEVQPEPEPEPEVQLGDEPAAAPEPAAELEQFAELEPAADLEPEAEPGPVDEPAAKPGPVVAIEPFSWPATIGVPEPPAAVTLEPAAAADLGLAEDDGPDRRLATAMRDGRTGLAYWYAVACRLPAPVQAAFEVLALSEAVTMDGDDASVRIRELLKDFDVTSVAGTSLDYLKVLAAGTARALMRMPFSPCGTVLDESLLLMPDESGCEFLKATKRAGEVGFELGRLGDVRKRSVAEYFQQRDEALARLRTALSTVRAANTKFGRATKVLKKIVGEAGEIGVVVGKVLAAPEDVAQAEHLLAELRDVKALNRLIDETDLRLNPVAAKRAPIISGALDRVRSNLDELLDALRDYVGAAEALAAKRRPVRSDQLPGAVEALEKSVAGADDPGELAWHGTVGYYAVARVKRWIREVLAERDTVPAPRSSAIEHDLARAFEAERLADGTVVPGSVTSQQLDEIAVRSALDAYEGFIARDDHVGAERLIDTLRFDGDVELARYLASRQPDDRRSSMERLRQLADRADREVAHALYSVLLSDSQSTELRGELERYRNPGIQDFPAARRHLDAIIAQVENARAERISHARQQLDKLECPDADRARISRLLDEGDLVAALEFVAHLSSGETELPAEAAADPMFGMFWPEFVQGVFDAGQAGDPGLDWLEERARDRGSISGIWLLPNESNREVIKAGLDGWLGLARDKRGSGWENRTKAVLNLLGFEVEGRIPDVLLKSGRWTGEIRARMMGNALVPSYGSGSEGRYQLLMCWGRLSPDRLLELVEELPRKRPIIVAYFNTLSPRDRRVLAERSRPHQKDISAVVIDHAVIAFLISRTEPRLQATMGLTLPFTAVNPYRPFVLGDVPREVFYGRKVELRQVQDADGPLYVYGGRQLGKSALLKTAMRQFAGPAHPQWRSIYLDLKGERIGSQREPDDLWPVLLPKLRAAGIIDEKVSAKAPPEVVVAAVRRWLQDDSERRLLLLLDEADDFLETDARPRDGRGADSRFANVYLLKNLMDDSGRRFKPVFAGLHKVQRFHGVSNGPMGHVGAEILIGPLPPAEAYKLVVEPLAAIGYTIKKPEVAWRLLAYTNYQASLIQLFCEVLVRQMHRRALAQGAPPTEIDDRDIERVYSDRDVRDWIASRFELTLDLDKRYRVIAYTAAWLTNTSDRQVFDSITLYDTCKVFWPTGFADLSLDDFGAYLDEMVGLGVLVRTQADEYGIRSPNVIRLLGAPAEIERKLEESEALEVEPLFDPAVFRRALGGERDRRSPLTEQQAQQILEGREAPDGREQLHVVIGSRALGLDRVAEALRATAPEDLEVRVATCDSIHAEIAALARVRTGSQHVVLDLAGAVEAEQRTAVRRLYQFVSASSLRSGSCLAAPSAGWLWDKDLPDVRVRRVRIRPWTQDTLRAWAADCEYPLGTTEQRRLLLAETGGWPLLVEAAASAAGRGSPEYARQEAVKKVSAGQPAQEFLRSVGMAADPVTTQVTRAAAIMSDEIAFDDLAALVEDELPEADRRDVLAAVTRLLDLGVLGNGRSGDSYVINPLIARLISPR